MSTSDASIAMMPWGFAKWAAVPTPLATPEFPDDPAKARSTASGVNWTSCTSSRRYDTKTRVPSSVAPQVRGNSIRAVGASPLTNPEAAVPSRCVTGPTRGTRWGTGRAMPAEIDEVGVADGVATLVLETTV